MCTFEIKEKRRVRTRQSLSIMDSHILGWGRFTEFNLQVRTEQRGLHACSLVRPMCFLKHRHVQPVNNDISSSQAADYVYLKGINRKSIQMIKYLLKRYLNLFKCKDPIPFTVNPTVTFKMN